MGRGFRKLAGVGVVCAVVCALVLVVGASPASATPEDAATQAFRTSFQNDPTVTLTSNVTLTCDGGGVAVRANAAEVTINGGGFTIQQTCAGTAVLQNNGNGSDTNLSNVTITGGGNGAVIAAADVVLDHTTMTGNSAGGSVEAQGSVQLFNSSITNGSYAIETPSFIVLDHSTIAFNTVPPNAGEIEAVVVTTNFISVDDSTVSNNSAPDGAIYGNSVSLNYSTVVENSSAGIEGANVNTGFNGSFFARTSVIAMPTGGPNCSFDFPNHSSGGFNWSDDSSCFLNQGTDTQNGTNLSLGSLAQNGGPTLTRLPQSGSPLIDRIPNGNCQQNLARFGPTPQVQGPPLDDQRGVSRPQGPACDTGAVEVVPSGPPNPAVVTIEALPATAIEGGADGGFLFERSGNTSGAITVGLQVSGTATSGSDYTAIANVTMAAGQSSLLVPVHALQDNVSDDGETVIAQVVAGGNYTVGNPSTATVTIKEHGFCDSAPQAPYTDRETFDVHARAIDCITAYGMAEGFDDGTYGATKPVSRAQMASFVARLMKQAGVALPADPPDAFPGDNGSVHELAINQLAALGVLDETTGQTGDRFNVSDPMKREDMAQILFNAYLVITGESLPPGPDAFTDDNSSDNQQAINSLAQVGVVEGTGGGLYDPNGSVSRAQMASFFVRYMQLLVGAGKLAPLS